MALAWHGMSYLFWNDLVDLVFWFDAFCLLFWVVGWLDFPARFVAQRGVVRGCEGREGEGMLIVIEVRRWEAKGGGSGQRRVTKRRGS
jgi:hypothetical protein